MKKKYDIKNNFGEIVYSTNPGFVFNDGRDDMKKTLPPELQNLRVHIERKNRKGKTVTIISGFSGMEEDLHELEKKLKKYCGTGGSSKEGEILIQGDQMEKVTGYLKSNGYKVK